MLAVFKENKKTEFEGGYNKLWKILIDKNMSKTQLREAAKIAQMQWQSWGKMRMLELKYLLKYV